MDILYQVKEIPLDSYLAKFFFLIKMSVEFLKYYFYIYEIAGIFFLNDHIFVNVVSYINNALN